MGCPQRMQGTGSLACQRLRLLRQVELEYRGLDLRVPPGLTCADIAQHYTQLGWYFNPCCLFRTAVSDARP
jgi:hypothetical protein